jgi:predicted transcriptional regulator
MLAHPVRVYILRQALEQGEISAVELSKRDGIDRQPLTYHCRQLLELGAIKIVRTDQRRGVMAHFYGVEKKLAPKLRAVLDALK